MYSGIFGVDCFDSSGGVSSGSSASQKWQQYFRVCSEAEPVVVPANVFRIVSVALSVFGLLRTCLLTHELEVASREKQSLCCMH